jgi:hypothetical protein
MSTAARHTAARDRAIFRLGAITRWTTVASVAAMGAFGGVAALSNDGASPDTLTAVATDTTSPATPTAPATATTAAQPTATATAQPTTAPTTTTGPAHTTTGSS